MKKNICLVGGGTGGHIFPLYSLAENLLKNGHKVSLIVNDAPLDRQVIADKFTALEGLNVHYLKTHKIDYHLSFRNLVAPFKILSSFYRTKKLINKINPDTVFFKGGFVGFPVLVALKYLGTFSGKIYLHDSDISAGKLTQFIGKKANRIFSNFGKNPLPLFYWPSDIKQAPRKKQILIFGGSQGAQFLNKLIVQNLEKVTKKYQIILVAGPKNELSEFPKHKNFKAINFMPQDKLIETMIQSSLVICRSGASMFQVLAAKTPCIAIPLPTSARNHQLHNAQYFEKKGLCYVLPQNEDSTKNLMTSIEQILEDQDIQKQLKLQKITSKAKEIAEIITKD